MFEKGTGIARRQDDQTDWAGIANSEEFKNLMSVKKTFIVPALVFFFSYFLSLAVLVGYAPQLSAIRVVGTINVAYLFALSQFAVGWIIASLYLLASSRFDRLTKDILARVKASQEGK